MERWCNEADIKWAVERELKKGTQVRNEEMCRERSAGRLRPSCGSGPGPAWGQRGQTAPPSARTTHSLRPGSADYPFQPRRKRRESSAKLQKRGLSLPSDDLGTCAAPGAHRRPSPCLRAGTPSMAPPGVTQGDLLCRCTAVARLCREPVPGHSSLVVPLRRGWWGCPGTAWCPQVCLHDQNKQTATTLPPPNKKENNNALK